MSGEEVQCFILPNMTRKAWNHGTVAEVQSGGAQEAHRAYP